MNSIKNSVRKEKTPKKVARQQKLATQQRSKNPIGQEKIQKELMFNREGQKISPLRMFHLLSGTAFTLLASPLSFAQTYTGDAADLVPGYLGQGITSSQTSNAEIVIDYIDNAINKLDFASAGLIAVENTLGNNYNASGNSVSLLSGTVGTIYSGSANYTFNCSKKLSDTCRLLNDDNISDSNKIINASNNKTIINANTDTKRVVEINTGIASLKSSVVNQNPFIKNNILTANNNLVDIANNNSSIATIFSGFVFFDSKSKIILKANETTTTTNDDNILQALNNTLRVTGSNNKFYNYIYAGKIEMNLSIANEKTTDRNDVITSISNNTLQSQFNTVDIRGDNNTIDMAVDHKLSGGSSLASIILGLNDTDNINSSMLVSADNNIIDASNNSVFLSGTNHKLSTMDIVGSASKFDLSMDWMSIQGDAKVTASNTQVISNANKVNIQGSGHQLNNIYGGHSYFSLGFGAIKGVSPTDKVEMSIDLTNAKVSSDKNSISLNGSSSISGGVYGGYNNFILNYNDKIEGSANITIVPDENIKFTANNNTVSINGSHNFANSSSIYGGYINSEMPTTLPADVTINKFKRYYDAFTGNTLNYNNSTPINIANIGNFQNYNFTIDPATANSGVAMITADKITFGTNATNLGDGYPGAAANSVLKVVGIRSGEPLNKGSEFILMDSANNIDGTGVGGRSIVHQGIALSYQVNTLVKDKQVIAIISSVAQANSQLKALLEGHLSGITLLTRGADMVAENLLGVISQQNNHQGLAPFLTTSGNRSRYNTGSSIKSNAGIVTGGLSWQQEQVTLAAFIENGWDSYKSHNDFKEADDVNGRGHNNYYGAGLYGHYDFMNGWYSDASLRVGRIRTAFDTDDIRNADGERAAYNISSTYYGAHLAGGYIVALNAENTLDVSVKYLWSGTQGQNVTVAGEPMHFDKLNSQRLRLNAENSYQLNPQLTLLAGLGYEYEFDGKAKGTTYGFNIDEPSLKGSTGIATVGARYVPDANNNLNLNVKLNGYSGKREGGGASFDVSYKF